MGRDSISGQVNEQVTRLHNLVREGDAAAIESLLTEIQVGHIVDMKVDGQTALHVAARLGKVDVVEVLMKVGHADIHARSSSRDTPLHLASLCGHEAVIEKLLNHGATSDLSAENSQGDTPLHTAAFSGKGKAIKRLLSAATDRKASVIAVNGLLRTPLHYAAASGKPKAVELLLGLAEPQALKRASDRNGALPFHFAACSGNVQCMDKLVTEDVNVPYKDGFTALHCAAKNGKVEAVKHLMDKGANLKDGTQTALHLAAISKLTPQREMIVEAILTKSPDSWELKNEVGKLAIGCAYECGHDDVVSTTLRVLRKRKSPLPGDNNNILTIMHGTLKATLLHYAAASGTEDDIKWLRKAADAMKKSVHDFFDSQHWAPLHWAARKGNTRTLKELTAIGDCNLRQDTNNGRAHQRPLFLALAGGHRAFAEELLRCNRRVKSRWLTTSEWMEGVDQWLQDYYSDDSRREVKNELESEFQHHTKGQKGKWLPGNNGRALNPYQEIPPVYLALHAGRHDIAEFFQRLSSNNDGDNDAVNKRGIHTGRTALHWAVLLHKREIVDHLCNKEPFLERVRVCEEDAQGISPVQYATERNMQDIEALLFKRPTVKDYIDGLYRDRQIYVDSTNAILVGAALIASVTFAGWLQPPLGFVDDHYDSTLRYVPIRQVRWMRIFWIFNSLSFFAAIATVQAGSCGVLPLRHVHIGRAVNYIRRALMVASFFMALSVVCVLCAFGAAGFIVLPPKFKFELYMMLTVIIGGLINTALIFWFIQRVFVAPRLFQVWRHRLLGYERLLSRDSPPPCDLPGRDGAAAASSPSPEQVTSEDPSQKLCFPGKDGNEYLCAIKLHGS